MAELDNPALLAIAQAKYRVNERLEDSRGQLNHLGNEVRKAEKVLQDAMTGRDRAAQAHAALQEELNELNKSQRILEKAIAEEKAEAL